jgi:tetratricopeptide (TPR) repeat protein
MKRLFAIAISLALIFAIVPEFGRYRGEHRLYRAAALFRALLDHNAGFDRPEIFNAALTSATEAANSMTGDSRPLILAGSLFLFAEQPANALVFYRRALALGERAEIDLNIGRAYEMAGDRVSASAAILRAAWINPPIVSSLPENVQAAVEAALAQNEELLREDRMLAPPPLPSQDSR